MPAPDTILGNGEVLLTETASYLGIVSIDNKTKFGIVAKVFATASDIAVGNYVMYEEGKGRQLMYGSTIYILIKQENISGVEVTPP